MTRARPVPGPALQEEPILCARQATAALVEKTLTQSGTSFLEGGDFLVLKRMLQENHDVHVADLLSALLHDYTLSASTLQWYAQRSGMASLWGLAIPVLRQENLGRSARWLVLRSALAHTQRLEDHPLWEDKMPLDKHEGRLIHALFRILRSGAHAHDDLFLGLMEEITAMSMPHQEVVAALLADAPVALVPTPGEECLDQIREIIQVAQKL